MVVNAKELNELRGKTISRFSEVEGIVCNLITAYKDGDLKDDNQEFRLLLIFGKEPFTKKIEEFEKLCIGQPEFKILKNNEGDKQFTKLRVLKDLRNFFAHARDVIDRDKQFKLYIVKDGKRITHEEKLVEFDQIIGEILPILRKAQLEIPYFKNFKKPQQII